MVSCSWGLPRNPICLPSAQRSPGTWRYVRTQFGFLSRKFRFVMCSSELCYRFSRIDEVAKLVRVDNESFPLVPYDYLVPSPCFTQMFQDIIAYPCYLCSLFVRRLRNYVSFYCKMGSHLSREPCATFEAKLQPCGSAKQEEIYINFNWLSVVSMTGETIQNIATNRNIMYLICKSCHIFALVCHVLRAQVNPGHNFDRRLRTIVELLSK